MRLVRFDGADLDHPLGLHDGQTTGHRARSAGGADQSTSVTIDSSRIICLPWNVRTSFGGETIAIVPSGW